MNVTGRINRILSIMSYVAQNQGVTLDELASAVGMRPKMLEKELDFMLLIGKPPFRPDDYVDIYVDEDERVYIDFDQSLNRPLRFTRPEAMALLLSIQLLDPEVEPVVIESLKSKISQAISNSVDPKARLEDRIVLERPSRPVSEHFLSLRLATEERQKVEMDYYSLARDATSHRVVRPYLLLKHLGYWYVTGHCEARDDIRTFKFERILSLKPLSQHFAVPDDFDVEKYRRDFLRSMGSQAVEILFDKDVSSWIREEWGSAAQPVDEGVILSLSSETLEFPSRLVLSWAPHARPLSPPELIDKVRQDAAEVVKLYESASVADVVEPAKPVAVE